MPRKANPLAKAVNQTFANLANTKLTKIATTAAEQKALNRLLGPGVHYTRAREYKTVRSSTRRPRNRGGTTLLASKMKTVRAAPLSVGVNMPQNGFTLTTGAMKKVDVDDHNSIRVSGTSCMPILVKTNTTDSKPFEYKGSALYDVALVPAVLDAQRCAVFSAIYTKYAIRRLKIKSAPLVSASTGGGLSMGVAEDQSTRDAFTAAPTCATAMAQRVATSGPYWDGPELTYTYDGVRTWHCSNESSSSADDKIQATLLGVDMTEAKAASAVTNGRLMCEYVVDLYGPREYVAAYVPSSDEDEKSSSLESKRLDVIVKTASGERKLPLVESLGNSLSSSPIKVEEPENPPVLTIDEIRRRTFAPEGYRLAAAGPSSAVPPTPKKQTSLLAALGISK